MFGNLERIRKQSFDSVYDKNERRYNEIIKFEFKFVISDLKNLEKSKKKFIKDKSKNDLDRSLIEIISITIDLDRF